MLAPKSTKTTVKPATKVKEWTAVMRRILLRSSFVGASDISFKDMPLRYEIYAGMRGKIHGDRNVKIPAVNAINNETLSILLLYWPLLKRLKRYA